MIEWERYLSEVLPSIPQCPDDVAENAVRNAAIDFCQQTGIWYQELDPVPVISTDTQIELDIPSYAAVATVEHVTIDDYEPDIVSRNELDTVRPGWRRETGSKVKYVFMLDKQNMRLVPAPTDLTASVDLEAHVTLKPSRVSYEGPDMLYEDYLEVIAAGAKAKLLNTEDTPWYDPAKAEINMARFRSGVSDAKIRVGRSHGRTQKRVVRRRAAI